jgi:hypothetical protein
MVASNVDVPSPFVEEERKGLRPLAKVVRPDIGGSKWFTAIQGLLEGQLGPYDSVVRQWPR